MNHKEIMQHYIWNRVNLDSAFWYQCVDWIRAYTSLRSRYITNRGNAIYLWNNWLGNNWKKVKSTYWNYPSEWDIVFFGTTWGKFGHTAVCNKFCNPMVLRTTDQNAGNWNGDWLGKNAILPFFRTYKWVVGWYTWIE